MIFNQIACILKRSVFPDFIVIINVIKTKIVRERCFKLREIEKT